MKEKKEQKGTSKNLATSSQDDVEKKRRSSLTDTPITSSSSSEAGMASTDSQPCSSKTAAKKKRKSQKKTDKEEDHARNQLKSLLENVGTEMQPVYTSANTFTPNTVVWSNANSKADLPVANCDMDVVLNNNNSFGCYRPMDYMKNDWMKAMKSALIEGNYQVFLCAVRYMSIVLYRRSPECKSYTTHGLVRRVIESIVTNFYEPNHQQTIFMNLCLPHNKRCPDVEHSYCRLTRTLLQNIDPMKASKQLAITTKMHARNALHLAVMNGDLCQVRVLLEYDIDVDAQDRENQTPLYYALKRKNLEMVKLLLWYGADFSQRPFFHKKLVLHAEAFEPEILHPWFEQRTNAISKKFYQFLAELCRGSMSFVAEDALSDLHIMRCSYNMDADFCNALENEPNWLARSINLNMREHFEATKGGTTALVFIVPFCYCPQDEGSAANAPLIYRTALSSETNVHVLRPIQLFVTKPILQTPDEQVFELDPAISNPNNGLIYSFRMPDELQKKAYVLSANMTVDGLSKHQKRTTLLGIQVFRVSNHELNHKKFN